MRVSDLVDLNKDHDVLQVKCKQELPIVSTSLEQIYLTTMPSVKETST